MTATQTGEEPTEATPDEPIQKFDNYFLIGTMNNWQVKNDYMLTKNEAADTEEYFITLEVKAQDELKITYYTLDVTQIKFYPDGFNNNYVIDKTGTATVYFRPNYDGGEDWYAGCIYVDITEAPATLDEPTEAPEEPTTAPEEPTEPAAEGGFYLVGSMTDWAPAEAYKLAKNDAAENEEFTITLDLTTEYKFKVAYSADGATIDDANWYPDGVNNDLSVDADGEYTVYFRPNGDGNEDWIAMGSDAAKKVIYIAATAPVAEGYYVGDVNNDGEITNRDAMILDRYVADWAGYDQYIKIMDAADMNRDGEVTNRDAMILDRVVAEWAGYYDRFVIFVPLAA